MKPVATNVDPESGKFTDRVLIGGLRPLTWDEGAKAAPAPAFTTAPILPDAAEAPAEAQAKAVPLPARPKEPAAKRLERTPESKTETIVAPPVRAASESAIAEAKPEEPEAPATLTPSSVSAKLAQKVWSGAKSLGGAMAGGLSWLGY